MFKKICFAIMLLNYTSSNAQVKVKDSISVSAKIKQADMYMLGALADKKNAVELYWQCARKGNLYALNQLGLIYKYAIAGKLDYETAFECFKKTAVKNSPRGVYYTGYMLHKGLGCTQDYIEACKYFRLGIAKWQDPACMYLLGISYRNGYGLPLNMDSANYWLTKSANGGYGYAKEELREKAPENNNLSPDLLQKIERAKNHLPSKTPPLNTYTKIETGVNASDLEGIYKGYLIKYDWSGAHIIDVASLTLELNYYNYRFNGVWREGDTDSLTLPFDAILTRKDGLVFDSMQYKKADHYNKRHPLKYIFKSAALQLLKENDTNYLVGNLHLFSPKFQEPEKPFRIALVQTKKGTGHHTIDFVNNDGNPIKAGEKIKVYPNPFTTNINVEFTVKETTRVNTQIITIDGRLVYTTPVVELEAGRYVLPLQPDLPAGQYLVKLFCNNKIQTVQIVKP